MWLNMFNGTLTQMSHFVLGNQETDNKIDINLQNVMNASDAREK